MLNFMIVLVASGFLPVQEEEKRVARWAPIRQGDTFDLNWQL